MDDWLARIAANKAEWDRMRPLSHRALANLEHRYDLELTYTSNAIEGNALTQIETNLVVEKGVTIGGKRLKDHLEAIDLYEAIRFVRELASQATPLGEFDVRNLHALVVRRSEPEIAGQYANAGRYILTNAGRYAFPTPVEVPALMGDFSAWLTAAPTTPDTAFEAHRRLVESHPFNDGNGRAAGLLMNLAPLRGGYPPVAVRPEDRLGYLGALQGAQSGQGDEAFRQLLYQRLDASLADHLGALRTALPQNG